MPVLHGEQLSSGVVKDLALGFFAQSERVKFVDVAFDFGDAGAGPVGAPEDFVGDFFDARKIFEEFLWRDAGDVHEHVFVAPHEEEGFVHPKWAAAMGEDDDEIGIVDADVVAEHGLRMKISRAGKDRSAGVNHYRQLVSLRAFVDSGEAAISLHVAVRREDLVRWMQLESADAEFGDAVDFGARIGDGAGQHAAEGDQSIGRRFAVVCAPVIYFRREADDFRCDVINEASAFDAEPVQKSEKRFWIRAIALDVGIILAAALDQVERVRLHHVKRHDVDVNVDDGLAG